MFTEWLFRALEESRARGFLGPGPLEPHVEHATGFTQAWARFSPDSPSRFLDLGSGGGLPGLYLLTQWVTPGVLMDAMGKRTSFLDEVLHWAGAPSNGTVVTARAEELARQDDHEGVYELVTARSFGPPAVTVECAIRFLAVRGVLIVSDPPDVPDEGNRWPEDELKDLGVVRLDDLRANSNFQILQKVTPTDHRYPRRNGMPRKRPLF